MSKIKIENQERFAMPYKNLIYVIAGIALMIIGYVVMTGGGATDPGIFPEKEMFSFGRIVLAPVLILLGFVVEIFAIMYKPKQK